MTAVYDSHTRSCTHTNTCAHNHSTLTSTDWKYLDDFLKVRSSTLLPIESIDYSTIIGCIFADDLAKFNKYFNLSSFIINQLLLHDRFIPLLLYLCTKFEAYHIGLMILSSFQNCIIPSQLYKVIDNIATLKYEEFKYGKNGYFSKNKNGHNGVNIDYYYKSLFNILSKSKCSHNHLTCYF